MFNEVNLFLRGIIPLIGLKSTVVTYERNERCAGESKYTIKKMLALAIDGITSFSVEPLRFITASGAIVTFLSFLALIITFVTHITNRNILLIAYILPFMEYWVD